MNSIRTFLVAAALLLGSAPAFADCVSGTRICRDTINRVTLSTSGIVSVFVQLGDHEDISCTAGALSCGVSSTCTDTDGLDLNPSSLHYDQAYQALLLATAGVLIVELTVDTGCNITTVTLDP